MKLHPNNSLCFPSNLLNIYPKFFSITSKLMFLLLIFISIRFVLILINFKYTLFNTNLGGLKRLCSTEIHSWSEWIIIKSYYYININLEHFWARVRERNTIKAFLRILNSTIFFEQFYPKEGVDIHINTKMDFLPFTGHVPKIFLP